MSVNKEETLKISVITVSYNAAATIEETILSVVDQTYPNIEYIIIDGGSTDGTVDIIKKYAVGRSEADKHNHTITKWISEPDHGIYDAMNKGIDLATGDYIYFIGADDALASNSILQLVSGYLSDIMDCVYYGNVILTPINQIYSGRFSKWTLIRKNICHQAVFYKRLLLKECPFDLKYKAYSDYYQNLLLWSKGIKFQYMDLIICNFRVGGFSQSGDEAFFNNRGSIIKELLGLPYYCYYLIRVKTVDSIRRLYEYCRIFCKGK